jgi:hypothetical protein
MQLATVNSAAAADCAYQYAGEFSCLRSLLHSVQLLPQSKQQLAALPHPVLVGFSTSPAHAIRWQQAVPNHSLV